jgi:hypothetical protein
MSAEEGRRGKGKRTYLLVLALHVTLCDLPEGREGLHDDLVKIPNEVED